MFYKITEIGCVLFNSQGKIVMIFPTETEAEEYLRERENEND